MAIQIQTGRKKGSVSHWEPRDYCTWFGLKGFNAKTYKFAGKMRLYSERERRRLHLVLWPPELLGCLQVVSDSKIHENTQRRQAEKRKRDQCCDFSIPSRHGLFSKLLTGSTEIQLTREADMSLL